MCHSLVSLTCGKESHKLKINPDSCDLRENDEAFYNLAAHQTLFLEEFTTATAGLKCSPETTVITMWE